MRRELHLKVAQAINENFADLAEAHPEVLARDWTEAGETEAAIAAWSTAGEAAEARSAFKEAQENYQRAVSLTTLLPESPERDSRELDLRRSVVLMLYCTSVLSLKFATYVLAKS
jgi:predicted ATPase